MKNNKKEITFDFDLLDIKYSIFNNVGKNFIFDFCSVFVLIITKVNPKTLTKENSFVFKRSLFKIIFSSGFITNKMYMRELNILFMKFK